MSIDGSAKEGLIAELGRFARRLPYEELPADVGEMAKTRLLDTLGCCLAGRELPSSRIAVELAKNSSGVSTVIGYGDKASMFDAALANAIMAHGISQDDLIAGVAHPGSVVVPAAIAVAEQQGASGAEFLTAIVVGYELVERVLRATGRLSNSAFRPGTIFATFGAAAAAGRLLDLSDTQLAHALGYAASLTPGTPNEGWWGGTMEPMFEIGVSSSLGIRCAVLAQAGATAAPHVLEGRDGFFRCWSGEVDNAWRATDDLGKSFAITRTFIKPFPACGGNQVPMQVALSLTRHNLKAEDIVRILEKLRPRATDYAGLDFAGPFSSQVQALMSMQFCAAATIIGRPVQSPRFLAENYDDPEVAEVARKVELVCEEGRTAPRFEVYTRDGSVYVAEETPDRSIHIPTMASMMEKFRALGGDYLGRERAERIIGLVMNLETIGDMRDFTTELQS
jgi:2-methylcitrate dehydratase PrpD